MRKSRNGHRYEQKCAAMLRRNGFYRVTVTRGSGDQGVDVIAFKRGKKYGIQCKYYASPVGNKAVQEAYAGARYYECDQGVVLTNSTFTPSARKLAKKTDIQLWERNRLPVHLRGFSGMRLLSCAIAVLCGMYLCGEAAGGSSYDPLCFASALFFLAGGVLGMSVSASWKLSFLSAGLYTAAGACFSFYVYLTQGSAHAGVLASLLPALLAGVRAFRLRPRGE